ncbi:30S ribosomal protein S18 [Saccharomonospora saliphila]|uniref:30S ribosomal protein S18 n=1 Tax=Saccharomonospora saliphila TaxID=369829 RepID=UPI000360A6A0|nr:30S ribosomal protein S18 [Saccharomonospora saliphila]
MVRRDPRPGRRKRNLLRVNGVEQVDWKDATLLRQFLSDRGKIRARRVTGLTPREQKQVATAIKNAREMALLPYPGPRRE